jgi:hypothetical protein
MLCDMRKMLVAVLLFVLPLQASAETAEEWITLGACVHGAFAAFIPLGIRIGLDAVNRLNAKPRELTVLYYDSDKSPCACFADGIAIATYASVGQRTLTISSEKAPEGGLLSPSYGRAKADRASSTQYRPLPWESSAQ